MARAGTTTRRGRQRAGERAAWSLSERKQGHGKASENVGVVGCQGECERTTPIVTQRILISAQRHPRHTPRATWSRDTASPTTESLAYSERQEKYNYRYQGVRLRIRVTDSRLYLLNCCIQASSLAMEPRSLKVSRHEHMQRRLAFRNSIDSTREHAKHVCMLHLRELA